MKRVRLLFSCIFIVLICLIALCSCNEAEPLLPPENVRVDSDTLILEWDEVRDARLYAVRISREGEAPQEINRSTPEYSLEHLDAGTYSIQVMAIGKDGVSADSEWSRSVPFIRERESGMVFALISGGSEYAVISKGSATGDIVIPDKYRDKPVTEIAETAFFNKSDVTSVTMGENVKRIGKLAFANCSYLTGVTLPDSLTYIGENAFSSCRSMSGEIVIPSGVTEISAGAFSYCGSIEAVELGAELRSIGVNAFTNCDSLSEIVIPDSVVSVEGYAFALCSGLASVSFGASLEHIGEYAFSSLPITAVSLPADLKTIGMGAFLNCKDLSFVSLGDGVEEIGAGAFSDTAIWTQSKENEVYVGGWLLGLKKASVEYVNFREDTVGIANSAFYGNKSLTDVILPNGVKFIGSRAFARSEIINMVIGSGVHTIGSEAFAGCGSLSTLILGAYDFNNAIMTASSLSRIESNAFYACEKLDSIKIPASVTSIGSYAFKKSGIEDLADGGLIYADKWLVGYTDDFGGFAQVRSGTVGIADYAFYECSALREIFMPSSLRVLGRAAFYNCTRLASVRFPETLEAIDDYTFYGCESYKVVGLPSSLRRIGRSAFYMCGSALSYLESSENEADNDVLIIPDAVTHIGDYAFYGCGEAVISDVGVISYFGIDKVVIGNSVEKIGDLAFYGFASLKEISGATGVVSIGDKAFYNCSRLELASFGEALRSIGRKAFYKCTLLSEIALPDTLEVIDDHAFYKCESLRSPICSANLSYIGDHAFDGCASLSQVTLPESLVEIGAQAFKDCAGMTSLVLHSGIESIGPHAFYGCFNMTFYSSLARPSDYWDVNWNSSYRPIVWGCVLSEDNLYVLSFSKRADAIENKNVTNTLGAPARPGYIFSGWDTNSGAESGAYSVETVVDAADGVKLFAIWSEILDEQ